MTDKKLSRKEKEQAMLLLQEKLRRQALRDYVTYAKEYIKIINKAGEQVPFTHNEIQAKINETVVALRNAGKPVRIIVLKARQEGVSTNGQGRMIYNTTTKKNRTGFLS